MQHGAQVSNFSILLSDVLARASEEIASLLEKKAVVPFPAKAAMGVTSTFFLAPKKSGEW